MEKNIYIAGAHPRGRTFREYINFLYPETIIEAFLVSDMADNDEVVDGVPVKVIDKGSNLNTNNAVYIATRGINHEKIIKELKAAGMKYIYPVDVQLDSKIRNEYVKKIFDKNNRKFCCIDDSYDSNILSNKQYKNTTAQIYVATSVFDRSLHEQYEFLPEECVIQVGTALTEERLKNADVFDNTGENISSKNKQFCELTAMYWIWKNAVQDVVGLVHYRRHFILPERWLDWMEYNDIDVILSVPLYVAPNLEDNYKGRHIAKNWEFMMNYMKENLPQDYNMAKGIFKRSLYSPCNMFIMRKEVLNELCTWLFPILDAVVEFAGTMDEPYQNRYPGFLSERLITYYFEAYRDKYKVAFANKNFLN